LPLPAAAPRRFFAAAVVVAATLLVPGWAAAAGPHSAHSVVRGSVSSGIGPCPDATLVPTSSNTARIIVSTLCLINAQRRLAGLVPLVEDTDLDHSAQTYSNEMVSGGYFQHNSPGGSTPLTRMTSAGYVSAREGYQLGENIAWGTLNLSTPQSIVTAWMASPGHRANILRPSFRQTGIGVAAGVPGPVGSGQAGATYTQDFGVITSH
jgi:uncharacterized protein YkwD